MRTRIILSISVLALLPVAGCTESTPPGDSTTKTPSTSTPTTETAMLPTLNLNTATEDAFKAGVPEISDKMVHEFLEYRPYVSIRQFRREMAKYVDEATIAGYEKYVFVPIAVDECDAETFMQIPGVTEAIAADLVSGRPHGSNDAFLTALERHIGSTGVAKAGNFLATP